MLRATPRQGAISALLQEMRDKPAWAATVTDDYLDDLICHSISQRGMSFGYTHDASGRTHSYDVVISIAQRYFFFRNL
jgi:hypothetical protein